MTPIKRTIDDPRAPERLRGKEVTLLVDEVAQQLSFSVDLPADATPQEIAYFKWSVGEIADGLRERFPFIGYGQQCTFRGEPR